MTSFGKIVDKIMNEEYEHGQLYVYHLTTKEALESIKKTGWERYFTGENSNSYGPGIYTTFRIEQTKDFHRTSIYGNYMLKCKAKNLDKTFVIFDRKLAQQIYGNNWMPEQQLLANPNISSKLLSQMKAEFPQKYHEMIWTPDDFKNGGNSYTNRYTLGALALNWLTSKNEEFNKAINGMVFHGSLDGYVVIFRNFTSVKPIAYSTNLGKTFNPISLYSKFDEYVTNNQDIRRELGVDNLYNNKTNTAISRNAPFDYLPAFFIGNYARVMKNGKYNYISKNSIKNKSTISNIWFDEASEMTDNHGFLYVSINEHIYFLKEDKNKYYLYSPKTGQYICNLNDIDQTTGEPKDEELDFDNIEF